MRPTRHGKGTVTSSNRGLHRDAGRKDTLAGPRSSFRLP
ncbi:hypothetical protein CAP2UW1_1351 [Candidatus Accumulibacter phosphatis]|uniref:Uncharacterized protein n=1 Tax=Accumulibacter regalis TaxID=522306 RepID=C7RSG2_ACCRE